MLSGSFFDPSVSCADLLLSSEDLGTGVPISTTATRVVIVQEAYTLHFDTGHSSLDSTYVL